ncbi:hypothetical protein [Halobellus limi]|uniref:CopG family transcriptional regulator n=1 Tax=Halobellus limi TaxID=699433 RepID=A0A1H6BCL1_9EURY|nr:hypothetical protein [Halobellus limi]QCC49283.1 hypothetical protein DV707_16180 [Halobellus limi]SEG58529.1 hypothetical protein SAMN04488133_2762 [Halobellus limi]
MTTEDTQIRLRGELVEQCEARIEGTEFESVEQYVQFVMETVIASEDRDADIQHDRGSDAAVSSDVEDRLASLGYR